MKTLVTISAILVGAVVVDTLIGIQHTAAEEAVSSTYAVHSSLPSASEAKVLLNTTHRHREWLIVPVSQSTSVLAWVVYPERADRAPLVVVSDGSRKPTDWTRAVSDQLAAEGYLTVVPDVLTEVDTAGDRRPASDAVATDVREMARRVAAVQAATLQLPSASGVTAYLDVNPTRRQMSARAGETTASFALSVTAWPEVVSYLNVRTANHPTLVAGEHAEHIMMMQAAQAPAGGTVGRGARAGGLATKDPALPAGYFTAKSTLTNSKLRKEWVDIPLEGSSVKLHTFIVYPEGNARSGVVIVMQHGVGLDDWQRALADQVAQDGFIAVAPDLWSGTGPNGGNWDSAEFIDDAMRNAAGKITPDETMRRYKAARDYALKLPRANGKTGSIGFCAGGGNSFRFAGEVPDLNAAVVFYGTPPDEKIMSQIKAPVLGFYGENDARVTATVEPTIATMQRLGKQYEPHVYPKATHSFVLFQDIGNNPVAIADAWPRVVAFYRKQLM